MKIFSTRQALNVVLIAGILEIVIAALGLIATFLEAGNFTAPAIVLLVMGILQVVLNWLTKQG